MLKLKSFATDPFYQIGLLIAVLLSHILVPAPAVHRVFVLAIASPLFLVMAWPYRTSLRTIRDPAFYFFSAYLLYSLIQSSYLVLGTDQPWRPLAHIAQFSVFMLGVFLVFKQATQQTLIKFFKIVSIAIGLGCIISLIVFLIAPPENKRLIWTGSNSYSILGGIFISHYVFATAWLLSLEKNIRIPSLFSKFEKALFGITILFGMITLYYARSRGVFLGMLVVFPLYLYFCFGKKIAQIVFALIAILMATSIYLLLNQPGIVIWIFKTLHFPVDFIQRGDAHRFDIWMHAVNLIKENPLIGYGLRADFPNKYPHPHNVILSILFYQGAIGLVLLVGFLIAVFFQIIKTFKVIIVQPFWIMLVISLIGGLTDYAQLVGGVSVLWMIIWFPIMAIWGASYNRQIVRISNGS